MSQKNQVRHKSTCQAATQTAVILTVGNDKDMPSQKRKEDAKQTLYLNRI